MRGAEAPDAIKEASREDQRVATTTIGGRLEMHAHVEVSCFRHGSQIGKTEQIAVVDANPTPLDVLTLDDIISWLGDIGKGFAAYMKGDREGLAAAATQFFKDIADAKYDAGFKAGASLVQSDGDCQAEFRFTGE